MLRFLRKYSSSVGIKILYGFLATLFVVWGVGTVGGERVDVVARVHGQTITRRELERTTATLQRQYEEMFKGSIPAELARSLDIGGRALDQLIDEALLHDEAERLGVTVSDAELVDAITKIPGLQDNGRFNRDRLESYLRSQRDRGEFEADVRRGLLVQRLHALVIDGVGASDGEVEERYRLDHEQVNLAFVRIAAADLGKTATLADEELERYLTDHADRYRMPARVRVRYATYRGADFAGQVEPTEGEIAEYYELNKEERFTEPEQVRARHILVKVADEKARAAARTKAEYLLAQAKAGADFAPLATKHSEDPKSAARGGDLGLLARGRMTPEFDAAAFALEAGGVSDLVETPFAFHIVKVEERRPGGLEPLDAVRDRVVAAVKQERGFALARKQAEDDRRSVVRGKPFAEAVGTRPLAETPLFTAGAEVPGVGRVPAFSDGAFALATGEVSDLIETDETIYLLAPLERSDASTPPLAEIRERVETDARRERGQALARERGEALRKRALEAGLEPAAAEMGAKVEETGPFDRRAGSIPTLAGTGELATDAFTLTPEAPLAPRVYTAGGDALVAALRARTPAEMAGFEAAKDGLRASLLAQKRQTAVSEYMSFLKARAQREGALEVESDAVRRG